MASDGVVVALVGCREDRVRGVLDGVDFLDVFGEEVGEAELGPSSVRMRTLNSDCGCDSKGRERCTRLNFPAAYSSRIVDKVSSIGVAASGQWR